LKSEPAHYELSKTLKGVLLALIKDKFPDIFTTGLNNI